MLTLRIARTAHITSTGKSSMKRAALMSRPVRNPRTLETDYKLLTQDICMLFAKLCRVLSLQALELQACMHSACLQTPLFLPKPCNVFKRQLHNTLVS